MLKPTPPSTRDTLLCPSSQPEVAGVRVLGIVEQTASGPEVSYLEKPIPATPGVLAMSAPASPHRGLPPRCPLPDSPLPAFRRNQLRPRHPHRSNPPRRCRPASALPNPF
jgi:hypothetical protein